MHLIYHKVAAWREAIEVGVAGLQYLPQYPPDLNPIESVFHPLTMKTLLRKAAEGTVNGQQRCVGSFEDSSLSKG
jgi:transposase